jgi:hypothetical protein
MLCGPVLKSVTQVGFNIGRKASYMYFTPQTELIEDVMAWPHTFRICSWSDVDTPLLRNLTPGWLTEPIINAPLIGGSWGRDHTLGQSNNSDFQESHVRRHGPEEFKRPGTKLPTLQYLRHSERSEGE